MNKQKGRSLFVGTLSVASLFVSALIAFGLLPDPETRLRPDDPRIVMQGEKLYAAHCASCHGAELEGETNWRQRDSEGYLPAPPHDETGHTWHHPDGLLFDITKSGTAKIAGPDYKTKMPAYAGELANSEIIAILSFIKSRWPEDIRARHDQLNATVGKR